MTHRKLTIPAAFAALALAAAPAAGQESITVASWGGAYQDAQRKAFFDPTAEALGITIEEATLSGLADVRVQVRSGAVTWDVVDLGSTECALGAKEGLFEPLDYSVIDADGIDKPMVHDHWIGIIYYSTVIAWNKETMENTPESWADFWDVEQFPGLRSLRGEPQVQLEIALMADGVPPDEVYPLDVDRAFKKMEEIKDDITTWWTSGAQSAQLIKDGEVDMVGIWNGRLSAAMQDGAKADYTYNQGVLNADCLAIPKGAPNKELAQKAIAMFVSPEQQAMLPTYINYGPVNAKAFELDILTDEQKEAINSSPENAKNQLVMDAEWWGENGAPIIERWDAMIQQ